MNFSKKNRKFLNKKEDSMRKTQKQYQFSKLQKSSIIFTQLGLILALLVVYLALEFTTEKKNFVLIQPEDPDEIVISIPNYPIIDYGKKKKIKMQKKDKPKQMVPPTEVRTKPDDSGTIETILIEPIEDPAGVIDGIVEVVEPEPDEPSYFTVVEKVPIFPGCEGLNNKESKKCFIQKISKFVNKRFNTSLAEESNITGKQKIWVQFTIDKTGKAVDIQAKSPYKNLEKEAIRVVNKLPKMTPGKQRTRPVSVKYTLPIVFEVY